MMTVWNVSLGRWELPIKVRKILSKKPGFMVILDTRVKQHELSEEDFTPVDWANIKPGSTITLIIKASVMTWRVRPPSIERSIKRIIAKARKKGPWLFFIWICEHCGISGCVEYDEGDDHQAIAERVTLAHQKEAKPECPHIIRIFDHRGMEQKDSALLVSSHRVE